MTFETSKNSQILEKIILIRTVGPLYVRMTSALSELWCHSARALKILFTHPNSMWPPGNWYSPFPTKLFLFPRSTHPGWEERVTSTARPTPGIFGVWFWTTSAIVAKLWTNAGFRTYHSFIFNSNIVSQWVTQIHIQYLLLSSCACESSDWLKDHSSSRSTA